MNCEDKKALTVSFQLTNKEYDKTITLIKAISFCLNSLKLMIPFAKLGFKRYWQRKKWIHSSFCSLRNRETQTKKNNIFQILVTKT